MQRATAFALYCIIFLLIVSLVNWALLNINVISYFENARLFKMLQLLIIFLQSVPLILFLFILKKNQSENK